MKKIFFLAGEASGDVLGSRLIKEIKARYPDSVLQGVGGHLMEEEGLDIVLPSDKLSVMGIWEIVGNFMRLRKIHQDLVQQIEEFNPDAVVTIDFPDFNFLLGSALKKRGQWKGKHIHYVAPSVWAWRPGRAKAVARFLDGIMCLFPFEPKYFEAHGLASKFIGHSLVEEDPDQGDGDGFRQTYGIPEDAEILGLLFGSRHKELKNMSKTLIDVALMVHETHPNVHLVVPTLPHLEYEVLKLVQGLPMPVYVVAKAERKWDAFAACDAAVAVSGTVGLELTYAGVPHVIAYKTSLLTWGILKLLVKVKYAHLVNILLGKMVVPEFLQKECDALKIGEQVLDLMEVQLGGSVPQKEAGMRLRGMIGAYDAKTPSQKGVDFIEGIVQGAIAAPVISKGHAVKAGNQSKSALGSDKESTSKDAPHKEKNKKKNVHQVRKTDGELPAVLMMKKIWVFLRNL